MRIGDLLVKVENENPDKAIVMIVDNHKKHLKSHIRFFYKKGMFKHIFRHIKLAYLKNKQKLPTIEL